MASDGVVHPLDFVLKVVSRCNLDCSYCYVYNKGDDSWRDRPRFMSDHVLDAALGRIAGYCRRSGQQSVHVMFHGGEPCLAGPTRFARWCTTVREALREVPRVVLSVQTNGTLLDSRWAEVFAEQGVNVGLSMDGPREVHDSFRVDHAGRGSYDRVRRGIRALSDGGVPLHILSVVQPGADGLAVHRHFLELGADRINYLMPDHTYDTVGEVNDRYGATPCADFLIPILEDWWFNETMDIQVTMFAEMARLVLGGDPRLGMFGNSALCFVFVESDGAIEGLDVLRVCGQGTAATGLDVFANDFEEIGAVSNLHAEAIFDGMALPTGCRGCVEQATCAGGYLAHRYSQATAFDNPSVWCRDILALFGRFRELLEVTAGETALRRRVLVEMSGARRPSALVTP